MDANAANAAGGGLFGKMSSLISPISNAMSFGSMTPGGGIGGGLGDAGKYSKYSTKSKGLGSAASSSVPGQYR